MCWSGSVPWCAAAATESPRARIRPGMTSPVCRGGLVRGASLPLGRSRCVGSGARSTPPDASQSSITPLSWRAIVTWSTIRVANPVGSVSGISVWSLPGTSHFSLGSLAALKSRCALATGT